MSLSKSKYVRSLQCPKILMMDKYKLETAEQILTLFVIPYTGGAGSYSQKHLLLLQT